MMGSMNEENLLKEIGIRLCGERKRLGLTQNEVAELAGYDRSYYSSVEGGKRNITFRTMCRIVFVLNRDVAFFLKDMPTPVGRTRDVFPEMTAADMKAAEELHEGGNTQNGNA